MNTDTKINTQININYINVWLFYYVSSDASCCFVCAFFDMKINIPVEPIHF